MERRTSLFTVLCVFIIGILVTLLTLSVTGVIDIKKFINNDVVDKDKGNDDVDKDKGNDGDKISYKEYKKFDEITLSNGTKWVVIKDSNKDQDYVVLLSKESFEFGETNSSSSDNYFVKTTNDELYQLDKELYNTYETYDNCILKKILEERAIKNIPVNLKEVDGYKIRLITVDEILSLDNNWSYNKEGDLYSYTGNNLVDYLDSILTMTRPQQPIVSKRASLYSIYTTTNYETGTSETAIYPFAPFAMRNTSTKPVINVYKNELN